MQTSIIEFKSYQESINLALDKIKAEDILSQQSHILIKPNLVNDSLFPVTTSAECCEAVIQYIQKISDAEIIIAEGCGEPSLETSEIFNRLGYFKLNEKYGVRLVDLNHEPLIKNENPECRVFKEMWLPEIAFSHFIISIPVLKAHSLADITGTLKNMMGFAPPKYYSTGSWRKARFHSRLHESIIDLNKYRTPDLSIMDASIGLADFHLGGAICSPPVNRILAGFDPVDLDRTAAGFLNLDWKNIGHLNHD